MTEPERTSQISQFGIMVLFSFVVSSASLILLNSVFIIWLDCKGNSTQEKQVVMTTVR